MLDEKIPSKFQAKRKCIQGFCVKPEPDTACNVNALIGKQGFKQNWMA